MVNEYFTFTKKERIGIYTLLVLIILMQALKYSFPIKEWKYDHEATEAFRREIAALEVKDSMTTALRQQSYVNRLQTNGNRREFADNKAELFEFDPNSLSADGWKRLGLKQKTIGTIQKYLSKGGKFYKPEDLRKIWGIHPAHAERLIPYVRINDVVGTPRNTITTFQKPTLTPKEKKIIFINSADSADFESLPGIGAKLASRIINFRNKLGGFTSLQQLGETFGLPDSTFKKIQPLLQFDEVSVKQININTATVEELKSHPYIRYHIANAIVQYRNQHGGFKSIEQLKKIMIITDEVYRKIVPYLDY
jgi:competence protein ComEA